MTILITCRVFMFADMQSGDSVIIKAQVSKSANRIPRNLWNLGNPQLSTFSTSWTDNASINGCIVCERGVGWKGAGGLKPLNGRLGSNWGRLMLDQCRQIWGYIGPWLTSDEAYGDLDLHRDGQLVNGQNHFCQKWKPFESDFLSFYIYILWKSLFASSFVCVFVIFVICVWINMSLSGGCLCGRGGLYHPLPGQDLYFIYLWNHPMEWQLWCAKYLI